MKELPPPYEYLGEDDWGRKLFRTAAGRVLVDVDGELCTITQTWGEPCSPTGMKTPEVKGC